MGNKYFLLLDRFLVSNQIPPYVVFKVLLRKGGCPDEDISDVKAKLCLKFSDSY